MAKKTIKETHAAESASTKLHVYTVTQITHGIKALLEDFYGAVWVEGEISNFHAASSGHFYFSLKDQNSLLAAAMFARANRELAFKIEDGQKVICFGRVDVYPPRGQYQLIVEKIEPQGIGAQQLAFEQLKNKLSQQGLFAFEHKKELPIMVFRVGIVTASTGAAVRDILQILKKGARCVSVVIRSVRVQGEGAHTEIAQGIADLNAYKDLDAIIVCRGGGSTEDLWSFNEEIVARAIYASALPVISAVGHQINTTLADLTADVFVETPSAAAKLIVDKKNVLLRSLDGLTHDASFSAMDKIHRCHAALLVLRRMLKSPQDRLLERTQLLDDLSRRLHQDTKNTCSLLRERLRGTVSRLEALSPLSVLSRGYSLSARFPDGAIIKDAAKLSVGDRVRTVLAKGAFVSRVEEVENHDQRKTVI